MPRHRNSGTRALVVTPVTLDQTTRPDAPDQERTGSTDVRDLAVLDLRRRAVLVPQRAVALTDGVRSEVRLAAPQLTDDDVDLLLGRVALAPELVVGRDPRSLSGGELQRLCLARALAVGPEVLLLDEPIFALDPIATSKIEDLLGELKKKYTLVLVTHNMSQAARISDDSMFMYLGELVEFGKTETIFTAPSEKRTHDYITGHFG